MPDVRPDAKAIFLDALERPTPEERQAFVDQACRGDEALRARVEELLQAHGEAGRFLGGLPRPEATQDQAIAERPGTVIGPYKLMEQIGEGGFGLVFVAEQHEPVRRKVALKILKPGMDTRQVIARFEAERQALAIMDHPNIAKVFDGGVTDAPLAPPGGEGSGVRGWGRPYFVMELVKGTPITQFCDENRLAPRQRLELFVDVCSAVQHAHQKGIIHRDIKPSNILVTSHDGKPVVKVIDFGVAKAIGGQLTDKTVYTQLAQLIGTPLYMSPEQAGQSGLDIDTRSDIYSLGVLLYELLTGTTPFTRERFQQAAYDEIRRIIREEDPPKPSTRLSELSSPHAPRAESGTRSVPTTLASVAAQRHTEPAKLTKLVKGELDWIVMKSLEKDRNRRYETAKDFAADVQRHLDDEPVQACPPSVGYRLRKFVRRNRVAIAITVLVLVILLAVTGGIGWNLRDRAARHAAVEHEVNLALKEAEQWQEQAKWPEALSAAKRAEGLSAGGGSDELRERVYQLRKDLEMVLRLEEIPLLWSEWKTGQFDYETADRAYARAFGDYGMNFVGLPADEAGARLRARAGVAVALVAALDDWAYVRSQKDKSGGLALTALAQEADPDPWRRQVRQAVLQKDTKALAALAASPGLLRQPPTSLLVLARAMRAGNLADAQIEVLRQAQRQYPGDFWINFKLAMVLGKTGSPYRDEAISFYRAALAVRPRSTAVHNNVGLALKDQGMLDEAIASYRKAIELDPRFAMAHNNLGLALQAQGKLDEAIAAYHKAISFDPKYVDAHNNFGNALRAQGKLPEATVAYEKAIELDPKFAMAHYNLGNVLYDQKMLVAAIAAYDKAIELDPIYAVAHTNLGLALNAQGKRDEAIASLRKAIEIDPKIAAAHTNLGLTLKAQGKLDEAIASLRKAIEIDPQHAVAHNNLGWALKDQGKLDEAIASFHKAIELDPKIAVAHNNLAWILANQGKLDEAIAILRKLIELDPRSAVNRYNLAVLLSRQGKLDEAIAAYHKAIELDPKYAQAYNGLAWLLATCPDARFRDQKQAVELAKKAVELAPKAGIFWSTLGVANYGAGAWKDAVATLEKSMELREGGNSVDCFVLAMAHAKLNDKEAARQWYDKAVAWMDKNQPKDEALRRLRAEAAELLGIEKKKD